MIYVFPVFLFGCTVTGVVFLGIIEAREQVKRAEATKKMLEFSATDGHPIQPPPGKSQS